jgi:Ca2+-binding EF-hand superfamily protein
MTRKNQLMSTVLAAALGGISMTSMAAPATSTTNTSATNDRDTHLTTRFHQGDTDKNGQLSSTEFKAMTADRKAQHRGQSNSKHRHHAGKSAERLAAKIVKADTNKDGQISKTEAQKDLPRLAQRFDQIDVNKNGQISTDEMTTHREQKQGRARFDGHKS